MFDAYKDFSIRRCTKSTWYKGMAFEFVRSIFEAFQFFCAAGGFRALVENKMSERQLHWPLHHGGQCCGRGIILVSGAQQRGLRHHYQMCAEKRIHIGERMKYMPMGYFNAQSLGSLTAAATSSMDDLESMSFAVIARTMVGMIRTAIFFTGDFLFRLADRRGVSFGHVAVSGSMRAVEKIAAAFTGASRCMTKLADAVLEYIQGMSVVRAFHGERAAKQTLNDTIIETERQNFKLGAGAFLTMCWNRLCCVRLLWWRFCFRCGFF